MSQVAPPPTWTSPVNAETGTFDPVWLQWFITIAELLSVSTSTSADVTTLKAQVLVLQTQVGVLQTTVAAHTTSISTLSGQISTLDSEIIALDP